MNSMASQSSSSGCDGGVPCVPKSFSVSTRPRPKYCCQTRFTITRAVSGFSRADEPLREVEPVRLAVDDARNGCSTAGVPGRHFVRRAA